MPLNPTWHSGGIKRHNKSRTTSILQVKCCQGVITFYSQTPCLAAVPRLYAQDAESEKSHLLYIYVCYCTNLYLYRVTLNYLLFKLYRWSLSGLLGSELHFPLPYIVGHHRLFLTPSYPSFEQDHRRYETHTLPTSQFHAYSSNVMYITPGTSMVFTMMICVYDGWHCMAWTGLLWPILSANFELVINQRCNTNSSGRW